MSLYEMKNHCMNTNCHNFTSNYDLSGIFCSDECWIQFNTGDSEKITRKELLQMKLNFNFDMTVQEYNEAEKLGLTKLEIAK